MSFPWWVVGLSALLGGAVGGGIVGAMRASPEESVRAHLEAPPSSSLDEAKKEDASVEGTQADAVDRIRRLEHRLSLLTAAFQKRDSEAFDKDGAGRAAAFDQTTETRDVADPVFEAAVLDIMDREKERKDEEQAAWRKGLHVERGKRYAQELAESLSLTPAQQTEIAQAVASYFDRWRALRDDESPDRPATRSEWRAERDKMNQGLDEQLKNILGTEYADYEALDADKKVGWGGRSRGANGDANRESGSGSTPGPGTPTRQR